MNKLIKLVKQIIKLVKELKAEYAQNAGHEDSHDDGQQQGGATNVNDSVDSVADDGSDLFSNSGDKPDDKKSGDEVDFGKLVWCYGGEDGSKAVESEGVQIRNLNVSVGSKISYSWAKARFRRTLKEWGLEDSDASAFAVFGYRSGDAYKCGKMDWISTSRTSRSWENIMDGYKGWNNSECSAAREFVFLILSKDRKRRSNVIRCVK